MIARGAELIAHVVAAILAYRRTRPGSANFSPALRPLFAFLVTTLAADIIRTIGKHFVLQHAARPFAGAARLVFHVDQAGVIGWHAGLLSVVALAFTGRERMAVKLVPIWSYALGTWMAFAAAYPMLREAKLGHAYLLVQVVTVLASLALAVHAWLRHRWFGSADRAVSLLVVGEIATLLGPFLGEPFRNWATANAISVVVYAFMSLELRRSATLRA